MLSRGGPFQNCERPVTTVMSMQKCAGREMRKARVYNKCIAKIIEGSLEVKLPTIEWRPRCAVHQHHQAHLHAQEQVVTKTCAQGHVEV